MEMSQVANRRKFLEVANRFAKQGYGDGLILKEMTDALAAVVSDDLGMRCEVRIYAEPPKDVQP